jgi:hypothetical protein
MTCIILFIYFLFIIIKMYTIHEFLNALTHLEDIDKRLNILSNEEKEFLFNLRLKIMNDHFNLWLSEEKELRYIYEK